MPNAILINATLGGAFIGMSTNTQKTYRDKVKCPQGHKFVTIRRISSVGKAVPTYCLQCARAFKLAAGPVPAN